MHFVSSMRKQNADSGKKPLHRSRDFEKEKRKNEKEAKKLNWFKGKDGKAFESVIMIPATPQGELKKIIEEQAKSAKLKVKVVEKAGTKLGTYLRKFDKTNTKGPCQEKNCMICQNTTEIIENAESPVLCTKSHINNAKKRTEGKLLWRKFI